nr:MAG TPA: hypothetical protein [Caudoviricetes sp.]
MLSRLGPAFRGLFLLVSGKGLISLLVAWLIGLLYNRYRYPYGTYPRPILLLYYRWE